MVASRGFGAWRSLVAHPAGGRAVGGSNPLAPIHVSDNIGKPRLWWLPNAIPIARLAGLPVLIWAVAVHSGPTSAFVAWLFAGIAITDFIDGKLARHLGAESRFGRIADPLADRLVMAVGLIALLHFGRLHWVAPVVILVRDAGAVVAFVWLARKGVEMRVDFWGKASSLVAMVATGMCLLSTWVGGDVLFWIAVALSVATIANYARDARRRLRASGST